MVLCFLAISGLLCIYILCVSFEMWVPGRMADLAHQASNGSRLSSMSHDFLQSLNRLPGIQPDGSSIDPNPLSPEPTSPAGTTTHSTTTTTTTNMATGHGKRPATTKPAPPPARAIQEVKPTEPAFIGDSYSSEDVQRQTTCPDNIAKKWSSTDFKEHFLATIPVLQWAKHATPQEYHRLQQFGGTHGWGGLNYTTLRDSLSVLNLRANQQMFDDWELRGKGSGCIRCAVVGNGGILNGSRKGTEIDGHHYVFRTNGAIFKGFEADVGTRTTHYTFSTNTMKNSIGHYRRLGYEGPPQSKETRYVFLPDHDRDYLLMKAVATHTPVDRGPEKSNSPPKYFGDEASVEQLKMYHPDFIRYLRNRFLLSPTMKTRYKDIYRPSTGSVMLLAALHTCDQVSAYGFMTPNYIDFSDHYYDKTYQKVVFYVNHDFRLEMALWQKLHKAGVLQLYMRP